MLFNLDTVLKAMRKATNYLDVNPFPVDRWVNVDDTADINLWSNGLVRGASLYQVNDRVVISTDYMPLYRFIMVCRDHPNVVQAST